MDTKSPINSRIKSVSFVTIASALSLCVFMIQGCLNVPKGYQVGPILQDGKYHCCVTGGGHEWKSKDNVHKDYDCFREIVSLGSGCPG